MDERTGIDMGASVAVLGPQIAGLPEVVDVTRLLAAEKAGKNRKRVLTCLEKRGRALWQLLASPKEPWTSTARWLRRWRGARRPAGVRKEARDLYF